MNPYFYLKIKKHKKNNLKKKFNVFIFEKVVSKKNNLKIYKTKQKDEYNKLKFKPCIFYYNKKVYFKLSILLLKFSLDVRKFNLWEKIDNWFHIFIFYNKKRWEDYTVFKNAIESVKYIKVTYYLFYAKKKNIFKKKLKIREQRNIKFWIWIFNINKNFTVYFHNVKSFLYKYIISKHYKFKFFKKNFIRYNLSLASLRVLSYILEENYKDKIINSSKSKWNSKLKRLINISNCTKNSLKKNVYLSYFYIYFKLKLKLTYFSYVIINDFRNTKILYFWLFRYFIFYIIEVFLKNIKVKLNIFYLNIDSLKCLTKLFKFKKFRFNKKKKKKKVKKTINFDLSYFTKKFFNLIILAFNEILDFLNLFVDKYLYNDFKNIIKKSKNYIYPEFKIVIDYIKKYFKR